MNYGLNLELERQQQSEQDWVFGGFSTPCLASIPELDRAEYLPLGEVQKGKEDFMDCASRGPINILETKFNWLIANKQLSIANEKWLRDKGYVNKDDEVEFSDRFVAINSGTTRQGNSLKAPIDAIRKQGLIPKAMLPANPSMTFDEYHNPRDITLRMIGLGMEFAERFQINYEKVYEIHFDNLLKDDLLDVGGFAWPSPVNGEYPKTDSTPNHCFIVFKRPRYFAFDNYFDFDGDFVKKLARDYDMLDYGYRILISGETVISGNWVSDIIKKLWNAIWEIILKKS